LVLSDDDLHKAIGRRVRAGRERAGLTQEALGVLVGLGRTSITNIEKGRQGLTVSTLVSLASALGKTPADLLPAPEAPTTPPVDSVADLTEDERRWIETVVTPEVSRRESDDGS
jgi:transcriptional regulator with XRE-family HTH domain